MAEAARKTLTLSGRMLRPNETTREYFDKRLKGMQERRERREAEIIEIASLAQPMRSRFISSIASRGRSTAPKANRLYDGKAIRSFRFLTGGMYSGLSSPNRPWFRFVLADADLMKYHPVKVWLGECEKIVAKLLATSNFYAAARDGYAEIGLFGTDACIMDERLHTATQSVRPVCFPQTFGEYWIAANAENEPDTLIRQTSMTVRQIVARFVASREDPRECEWSKVTTAVMSAWDNSNYETEIGVFHAIEPNPDYVEGRADAAGKPWRSVKWEEGQSDRRTLLEEGGYWSQPFWAPRWQVVGSDVYGHGPGHDALADMRVLQLQAKRKGDATDFAIKPPIIAPAGVKVKLTPGSVTYAAAVDQASIKELYKADYRAIGEVRQDVADLHEAIDEATYARLFMAISNLEGSADRTVPEITAREEEKLTQLGPVIERVNTEKLQIAIDRVFDIAARNELLPPPPPELEGMIVQIDFISILAQAARMVGISQTERAIGFVGTLESLLPGSGAGDNVDVDALVADHWERSGAPAQGLRDTKVRDKIRTQRAQEKQTERLAAMAPALRDVAGATRDAAETPVADGTRTLFDSLVQQPPI